MTTEALKSAAITNLDASPPVAVQAGNGAGGYLRNASGYVTVSASMAALSTYQLVRFPTNARVKQVLFESEAQGAGKFQLGLYYSTSAVDGTPVAKQGLVVTSAASVSQVNFFSGDIDCASAVAQGDKTYNGTALYTLDKRGKELWDAAGLTSDPGGFFDLVATVHTTDVTTGTGKLGVSVNYVD